MYAVLVIKAPVVRNHGSYRCNFRYLRDGSLLRAVIIRDVNFLNLLFFFQDSMKKCLHCYRARGC